MPVLCSTSWVTRPAGSWSLCRSMMIPVNEISLVWSHISTIYGLHLHNELPASSWPDRSTGGTLYRYRRSQGSSPVQWPVCRKSRKIFGPQKPFVKLRTANFAELVFSYVVNGKQLKKKCKVLCLETPSFWRYKENYVTRNAPEKFRDFRETGPRPFFRYCKTAKIINIKING